MLHTVTSYMDRKVPEEISIPPQGWEIWLKNEGKSYRDFMPTRLWINHEARTMSHKSPVNEHYASGSNTDDRKPRIDFANVLRMTYPPRPDMDHEYLYWSFMEAHPSHAPLPYNAYSEALDALTWSYTSKSFSKILLRGR